MSYKVVVTDDAAKYAKQLHKRYNSFKADLAKLISSLEQTPQQGEPLGKDCYKVRLAIKAKKKGKSGGARVITCVKIVQETVFLLSIYDKSEAATISDKELKDRLKNAGLYT
ncbi:type II toxin-antitoxin system RelE/ParE family toxin [Fibrisoma limi]|nr:type II toxin-antitoxin system RelE/ParE family toxin [Fibrisoma limi]